MVSRVRIEDVAEAARVSMKTVSRVLNREPNVREETRERVLEAVARLNYIPHFSARSLAGSKSYLVALLYNNPSDNYLMGVMSGALAACEQQDYAMLLCPVDTDVPALLEKVEGLVRRSQPDGLVLTPPITDVPELRARLADMGIPVACISPKDRVHSIGVGMDETQAACDMVLHLAALGHRRIAHIAGHPIHGATDWRIAGYRLGLQRAGIDFDPALLVPGEFSFDSGVRGARALLRGKRPPTAIFAANDDMAAGVISEALEAGLGVPDDLSVCGFDDTPMSTQIFPALTTVHQPTHEMGRLATLELLAAIQSPGSGRMLHVPYTLQVRRSSGPAPRGRR